MNHIRQILLEGKVLVTNGGTSATARALRPEQEGVVWMKNVIRKVTSPGKTVVDPFQRRFLLQEAAYCYGGITILLGEKLTLYVLMNPCSGF